MPLAFTFYWQTDILMPPSVCAYNLDILCPDTYYCFCVQISYEKKGGEG